MRVFIPTTFDRLRAWFDADLLPAPVTGWAVTDSLRTELGEDLSEEEAEYAVTTAAAEASQELLTGDFLKRGRRVVVAVELPYATVEEDVDAPGAVTVAAPIEGSRIAAVLADVIDVALTGNGEVDDLAWFAVQEIPQLLASTPEEQADPRHGSRQT